MRGVGGDQAVGQVFGELVLPDERVSEQGPVDPLPSTVDGRLDGELLVRRDVPGEPAVPRFLSAHGSHASHVSRPSAVVPVRQTWRQRFVVLVLTQTRPAPQLAEVYPQFAAQVFGIGQTAFAR